VKRAWLLSLLFAAAPAWALKPDLTHKPSLPPPPPWKAPVPASATTAAGTRVVVLPEHELPLVHVLVTVPAGSALDPPNRPGLAAAVAMMLQDGGAGTRNATELAQAFADLGAEVEEHVDSDEVQLQLTVLSRNLPRALALVGDLLARPRFDAAEWKRAQARRIDEIRRRTDEPHFIATDVFARVIYGDHPYGHPFIGNPASVAAITVDDLRRFHAAHYSPRTVSFVLVGDSERDAAAPVIAKALADWRSTAQLPAPPPQPQPLPPRVVIVDRPGAPQSQVRIGHLGRERTTPDFAAVSLLETVLGGSFTSRLNQNLREKHGYTYGARANFDLRAVTGPFWAGAGIRTDVTAPALAETVNELTGMHKPLSPDEVIKGRSLVLQAVVEAFSDGNQTAEYLADLVAHNLPLDYWSKLPAALAALDVPALTKLSEKLFWPDRLTIVIVGDKKVIEPALRKLPFIKNIELRDSDGKVLN
jgi:zinc protease